jgi:hypothetical protein
MHCLACPPTTSEAGASRPKSLAGAIFMVYPQKYENCSTLVPASEVAGRVTAPFYNGQTMPFLKRLDMSFLRPLRPELEGQYVEVRL